MKITTCQVPDVCNYFGGLNKTFHQNDLFYSRHPKQYQILLILIFLNKFLRINYS